MDYFQSARLELHRILSKPFPDPVAKMPSHSRSRESIELWLKHYRVEQEKAVEKAKQLMWIGMRSTLDLLRRFKANTVTKEELLAARDHMREEDAKVIFCKDKPQH